MDFSDQLSKPKPLGIHYDPDTFDRHFSGRRNLWTLYYPLKFWNFPDYVPPADGQYRYELFGGVEQHDNLNAEYLKREIGLALSYGIDGFIADSGGPGSFEKQIKAALAVTAQFPTFWWSVDYDWYYCYPPFGLMREKSDYEMAADLLFFMNDYAANPHWLRFRNLPVLMAVFMSNTVLPEKWRRVNEICCDPSSSSFYGDIAIPSRMFRNRLTLSFEKAERPGNGDQRSLAVAFDYIKCLDRDLQTLSILDIGTAKARPHLISGWSKDEQWDDSNFVWAEGKTAILDMEILPETQFIQLRCSGAFHENMLTISINGSPPEACSVPRSTDEFIFRLSGAGNILPAKQQRPYTLFLDSVAGPEICDGYANYGAYLQGHRCVVSDLTPIILTVSCGYDDRKQRLPGFFIDREKGALYRRNWELALAQDPDVVLINTWNEWPEGTNIAPSVEFGYLYVELTLTYSLMLHRKLSVSAKPSELGLTIKRYDFDTPGASEIRLSAEKAGQLTFHQLPITAQKPGQWQVLKDGQPYGGFTVNPKEKTLTIQTQPSHCIYIIIGIGLENR